MESSGLHFEILQEHQDCQGLLLGIPLKGSQGVNIHAYFKIQLSNKISELHISWQFVIYLQLTSCAVSSSKTEMKLPLADFSQKNVMNEIDQSLGLPSENRVSEINCGHL